MHLFLAQAAEEESSGGLIDVVPGLMIWTLICFAITFFVLKRFAFGPIQKTIDERRDRIRAAVDEADKAREEARELLEQHRQLDRGREGRGGGHPRGRAQGRGRADRAREGGVGGRARAPARGDEAPDRRRDEALARPDPHRGRRPHARGDRARDRQGARRRGSAPAHRRGDRRARLLRAGEGSRRSGGRAAHVRPRALPGGAGAEPRRRGGGRSRRARARDGRGAGAARLPAQPSDRAGRQGAPCSSS